MADMEIDTDDAILLKAATDGSMEYSHWPRLLPVIVSRIEKIAHTEFPIPHIPPPPPPPRPASPRFLAPLPSSDPIDAPESSDTAAESQDNKENAIPSSSPLGSRSANASSSSTLQASLSSPPAASGSLQSSQQLPTQPPQREQVAEPVLPPGTLPTQVVGLLNEVTSTLTLNFPTYPPHTLQRLAELVIRPRQHYRSVVSYLHALDRVVHVTSGANQYPLPPAVPDLAAMSQLVNGTGAGPAPSGVLSINTTAAGVGSDEALGGALLTPIPWMTRQANGGTGASATGGSDDGHSDAESSSPLSAGASSGPNLPQPQTSNQSSQAQQQRQSPTSSMLGAQAAGTNEGGNNPKLRTESTETIEGPNGMGSIETVTISVNGIHSMGAGGAGLVSRGVTQGEILRQEQRAGVVPFNQFAREVQTAQQQQAQANAAGADEDARMTEDADIDPTADAQHDDDEEVPHARGPEEIGAADMGPQPPTTSIVVVGADGTVVMRGVDVDAAVGRRHDSPGPAGEGGAGPVPESSNREAAEELPGGASPKESELKTDAEGDVVLGDGAPQDGESSAAGGASGDPPADEDKVMTGGEAGTGPKEGDGGKPGA